jgi:hypothetical protein
MEFMTPKFVAFHDLTPARERQAREEHLQLQKEMAGLVYFERDKIKYGGNHF